MSCKKALWYVVDYGNAYGILSSDDFDKYGCYKIDPTYTLDDFCIVAKYTTFDAAWNEAERLNGLLEKDRY